MRTKLCWLGGIIFCLTGGFMFSRLGYVDGSDRAALFGGAAMFGLLGMSMLIATSAPPQADDR